MALVRPPVSYPGVYIQEVESDVHTITPVDTATTAFIGRTARGPVNQPVICNGFADFQRIFGGIWSQSKLGYAVDDFFLNGGAKAVIVRVYHEVEGQKDTAALTLPGANVKLLAKEPGGWGNNLVARVDDLDKKIAGPIAAKKYGLTDGTSLFNLTIRDTRTGVEEYFPNLTVSSDPNVQARRIDKVLEHQSNLVTVDPAAFAPTAGSTALALTRPTTTALAKTPRWWEADNQPIKVEDADQASDGAALIDTDILGNPAAKTGMYALEHADIFNMLCIPPYAEGKDEVETSTLAKARDYCERRRAILLVDPPSDWTTKDKAVDGFPIDGLPANSHSAIFFPRIKKADPLRENQIDTFVPCGAIAGIMARTDFRRGVWKAAAGLEATIEGIAGLSVPLTDAENGELNPLGINCLRTLPAVGPVVWGARTMEGDDRLGSQWKYIPVRRMALWIEESLYRGTQWAVFEPNDEPLWSSLRLNIGVFMNDLFRQGAFQGQSPKDAYFVKCDSSTTLQSDIDRGIVNVIVGFAPLKPAEFVILYIQQITGNLTV
jgi:phage tail sheath protein FI